MIKFHWMEEPATLVTCATRKRLANWAMSKGHWDTDDENVNSTWQRVRGLNESGAVPYVYIDPYTEELSARTEMRVHEDLADAEQAYREAQADI